jgi:asparagine synthase (glutamine-hydrolysing)
VLINVPSRDGEEVMSAQFGQWNFNGKPIDPEYLAGARAMIAPYGPDGAGTFSENGTAMVYAALRTTKESRKERQPHLSAAGDVLVWDGRLDSRESLIEALGHRPERDSADTDIVAQAWDRWGIECFPRLIGDWALAIWQPKLQSLILAKDPIGTRHLYYTINEWRAAWSTVLEPLVRFDPHALKFDEEYIAGWLASFPATDRTPYASVRAVPPACCLLIHNGASTISRYWDFDPGKRIRYRSDSGYEEHFRVAFRDSVRRRLRSNGPVVAELSGGMDSSSIVCVADDVIARADAESVSLDTVSYYTDSEPSWNDLPYFTVVEDRRGHRGCHIEVSRIDASDFPCGADKFQTTPASNSRPTKSAKQFADFMTLRPSRVLLSGIGGDEITGGAPVPTPELADLIATCALRDLGQKLKQWALETRKPWLHLFWEAAVWFLVARPPKPAPWLVPAFVERHALAFSGYQSRWHLFGALPSFQAGLAALDELRRQLAVKPLFSNPAYETRYPFLDRDLLEFLLAIPREQLVRPGERRSLMRRALRGTVPREVLDRRRKAFAARMPRRAIASRASNLLQSNATDGLEGIVDHQAFITALEKACSGDEVPLIPLLRTIGLQRWLRSLDEHKVLTRACQLPIPGFRRSKAAEGLARDS